MSEPPGKQTFGQIFRQQYRRDSSTKWSRANWIIRPIIFLICAFSLRHWPVAWIILPVAAVLMIAGPIIVNRRKQHHNLKKPSRSLTGD